MRGRRSVTPTAEAGDGHAVNPYRRGPVGLIVSWSPDASQPHSPSPAVLGEQERRRWPSHQVPAARKARATAMAGSQPTTAEAPAPMTPAVIRMGSAQHATQASPARPASAFDIRRGRGSAAGTGMAVLLGEVGERDGTAGAGGAGGQVVTARRHGVGQGTADRGQIGDLRVDLGELRLRTLLQSG